MADADARRVTDEDRPDGDDAPEIVRESDTRAADPSGDGEPTDDASHGAAPDAVRGDIATDDGRDDVDEPIVTVRDDETTAREDAAAEDDATPTEAAAAPEDAAHRGRRRGKHEPGRARRFVGSTWFLILVALVVALVVKTFLIQAFYIPSRSMVPTLAVGDRVFVNKLAYELGDVHRGDVIVFSDPNGDGGDRGIVGGFAHWLGEGFGLSQPNDEDYIKRVVGLPGETIEIADDVVYIDGEPLEEPYLTPAARRSSGDYALEQIPDDAVFVMGDNRGASGDSRTVLGFVPLDRIIGRAFVIIWPPSDVGGIDDGA